MEESYKFANRLEYVKALDSVMPETYIQERKIPTGMHKYLPAAIKEAIADDIFHYWNVIDEKYAVISNELICTIKLTFIPSYPGADELFCTGSAAVPVQMESGSKPNDFPNKKKTNALEYNLPSVRSESISNALGSLGNIFGRNLNRKLNGKINLPVDFTIRKHDVVEEIKKTEVVQVNHFQNRIQEIQNAEKRKIETPF